MISNRGVRCLLSIHVLVSFVLVGVAASGAQKGGEPELEADFPSLSAVYKEFKPQSAVLSATDSSWSKYAYPKGAKKVNQGLPNIHFFNLRTGSSFCSEYFTVSTIYVRTGTVIAFPREGFEVERSFTYIDLDESGKKAVLNGKWVAVDVVIGYPNELKPPSEHACAVTVKNLGDVGMMIPVNTGKPGKIIAVKEAARRRFGASRAQAYYHCSDEGKIKILLLRCKEEKENPKILPATYEGR